MCVQRHGMEGGAGTSLNTLMRRRPASLDRRLSPPAPCDREDFGWFLKRGPRRIGAAIRSHLCSGGCVIRCSIYTAGRVPQRSLSAGVGFRRLSRGDCDPTGGLCGQSTPRRPPANCRCTSSAPSRSSRRASPKRVKAGLRRARAQEAARPARRCRLRSTPWGSVRAAALV